jgi:hypothetical protein
MTLCNKGFFHSSKKRPCPHIQMALSLKDFEIIRSYNSLIYIILNYYGLASNFLTLKGLMLQLKQSCILTLAYKHKKTKALILKEYEGPDVKVLLSNGRKIQLITTTVLGSRKIRKNLYLNRSFLSVNTLIDFIIPINRGSSSI